MKIDWNKPKGTENFSDAQMAEFYAARAEYVRYLQSNKIENLTEADIDEHAIKSLQCLNVLSDVIL